MDAALLVFFNQTLAHPLLDGLMIGASTFGLLLLPMLGLMLYLRDNRRLGVSLWTAFVASLALALIFQYLILRPRPDGVRLLLSSPDFPSYPSGHTAAAFGVAMVISLGYRRWPWPAVAIAGAGLIGLSRVYLGHHYPSDIFGGAVLGIAVGAACYGLVALPSPEWKWLLWPQIALVVIISQVAYMGFLPLHLMRWPLADKVMHFLLFGAVTFWLNFWFRGSKVWLGLVSIPLAILLPFSLAVLEEALQSLSMLRSADVTDLASDVAGMLFFWWLSNLLLHNKKTSLKQRETSP